MSKNPNIVWHHSVVSRQDREQAGRHKGVIVWFTGLSGAGKSTLAHAVEDTLFQLGCRTFVLDGDNIRHGLCQDLAFSDQDRVENIRRVGEVAKLFMEAGVIVLTAFISPFQADRQRVREMVGPQDFIEVYCNTPMDICEQRDVKGLYNKARQGHIQKFTGISSPYEPPQSPEIVLATGTTPIEVCIEELITLLRQRHIIST